MISAENVRLVPPRINFIRKSTCPEVNSLVESVRKYFSQENIIHDCELVCSNNEYVKHQGEYGTYLKRHDVSFNLRELKEMNIYHDRIVFRTSEKECSINIGKDFFYFIDCEEDYYL